MLLEYYGRGAGRGTPICVNFQAKIQIKMLHKNCLQNQIINKDFEISGGWGGGGEGGGRTSFCPNYQTIK